MYGGHSEADGVRPAESGGDSSDKTVASGRRLRAVALAVLLGSAGVVGLAAWLKPDPRGLGTHQQLGSAPCGMIITTGYPCPTCGMTTAFAHTVRGQWFRAFYVQPAGFVFALSTIGAGLISLWVLTVGRLPAWVYRWSGRPFWWFVGMLALLLGGWAFKLAVGVASGALPVRGPL